LVIKFSFSVVINKNSSILKFYKKISFVSFCSDIFRNYCRQFFIKFQSWVKEGKRREFNKKKLVHKVGKNSGLEFEKSQSDRHIIVLLLKIQQNKIRLFFHFLTKNKKKIGRKSTTDFLLSLEI